MDIFRMFVVQAEYFVNKTIHAKNEIILHNSLFKLSNIQCLHNEDHFVKKKSVDLTDQCDALLRRTKRRQNVVQTSFQASFKRHQNVVFNFFKSRKSVAVSERKVSAEVSPVFVKLFFTFWSFFVLFWEWKFF